MNEESYLIPLIGWGFILLFVMPPVGLLLLSIAMFFVIRNKQHEEKTESEGFGEPDIKNISNRLGCKVGEISIPIEITAAKNSNGIKGEKFKLYLKPIYKIKDSSIPFYSSKETINDILCQLSMSDVKKEINESLIPRIVWVTQKKHGIRWLMLFVGENCLGKLEASSDSKCLTERNINSYNSIKSLIVNAIGLRGDDGHPLITASFEPRKRYLVPDYDFMSTKKNDNNIWIGILGKKILILDKRIPNNLKNTRLFFLNNNSGVDKENFKMVTMTEKEWKALEFKAIRQNNNLYYSILDGYEKFLSAKQQLVYKELLDGGFYIYSNQNAPKEIDLDYYYSLAFWTGLQYAKEDFFKSNEISFRRYVENNTGLISSGNDLMDDYSFDSLSECNEDYDYWAGEETNRYEYDSKPDCGPDSDEEAWHDYHKHD